MISKMTEPTDRKRQFSIEVILKITEPYTLCEAIPIPTEKTVQY